MLFSVLKCPLELADQLDKAFEILDEIERPLSSILEHVTSLTCA